MTLRQHVLEKDKAGNALGCFEIVTAKDEVGCCVVLFTRQQ